MKRRRSREKNPEDVETVKNAVAKIHASGDILMKIINDVLDLSKLENGKAELRENGVCLPELIEKLSHMLEYSMEQKRLRFRSCVRSQIHMSSVMKRSCSRFW